MAAEDTLESPELFTKLLRQNRFARVGRDKDNPITGALDLARTFAADLPGKVYAGVRAMTPPTPQERAARDVGRMSGETPAAATTREIRGYQEPFNLEPETATGQRFGQTIATGLKGADDWLTKNTDLYPGAKRTWENFTTAAPVMAAGVAGVAEVADPTKLKGKALSTFLKKHALGNIDLRGMPPQEAIQFALDNKHLFEIKKGDQNSGFVAAPRTIMNRADLDANRARMDAELDARVAELEQHGIKPGSWYESQRRGVEALSDDPAVQSRIGQARGLFSPQTDPKGETMFLIQAWNRLMREQHPGVVHTGRQGREFEAAMNEGRPMKQGPKTEIYAWHSDPTKPQDTLIGANDFRHAQFHGYTDPQGKAWTAGLSKPQHNFMDAENMLLQHRANVRGLGGRNDWTVGMVQEAAWIVEKADALQKRFPARFPPTPEGRRLALNEGAKSGEAFLRENMMTMTHEPIPGRGLGHNEAIIDAPVEERNRYGVSWGDKGGRDVLYPGALQMPMERGIGEYRGDTQPVDMSLIAADTVKRHKGRKVPEGQATSPDFLKDRDFAEALRAGTDVQQAWAANRPMTGPSVKNKTGFLIPHEGKLGAQELGTLQGVIPEGWMVAPTAQGTMMIPPAGTTPKRAKEVQLYYQNAIQAALGKVPEGQMVAPAPGRAGPLQPAGTQSNAYNPMYIKATEGKGAYEPTERGKGVVTSRVLEAGAKANPATVRRMAQSAELRNKILEKRDYDAQLEAGGAEIRPDVQKFREFFGKDAWQDVVAYMRKHRVKAGTAMAALGFSLEGMAAEEPQGQR